MLSDTMMLGGGRKAAYSIENSLLFRGGQYLKRTPGAVGNGRVFTLSCWVRRAALNSQQTIFSAGDSANLSVLEFTAGNRIQYRHRRGVDQAISAAVFQDTTSWLHIVLAVDTKQGVAEDRVRLWANGQALTFQTYVAPLQYDVSFVNLRNTHTIGTSLYETSAVFRGEISSIVMVDGAALAPGDFGAFDAVTRNWAPKPVTLNTQLPTYQGNLIPPMTAYTAPSGKVTASNDDSVPAWHAFNRSSDPTDGWQTSSGVGWICYAFPAPSIVSAYSIQVTTTDPANRSPKSWTFEGYNGSGWVVLDTQSAVPAWGGQEKRLYTFSNGTAYSSYRLNISALQGNATIVSIKAIEFFSSAETSPYGTNGFYLGSPWNRDSLGTDYSGEGNHWTPSGFVASDVLKDSPTNVYATLNPLDQGTAHGTMVLSDGNLTITNTNDDFALASVSVSSGKWYWEISSNNWAAVIPAIWKTGSNTATWGNALGWLISAQRLWSYTNGNLSYGTAYSGAPVNGTDIVGVALDCDSGTLSFYKNRVSLGTAWSTGIAGHAWQPQCYTNAGTVTFNFGQRAWAYPPPSGFKALCTANLSATSGQSSGSFTGNASEDGPCIYTGAVPVTLIINGNTVTWGTHADRLATGFKIRTASTAYNSTGSNTWAATYDRKPTVGGKGRAPASAQAN